MHYIIPGPIMAVAIMIVLVGTIVAFANRVDGSPQIGTGIRVLCSMAIILLLYINMFTNWVDWPMESDDPPQTTNVVTFTIYTTKDNCQTITEMLQDYSEVPEATYSVEGCE